jgi:hypothetical protein
MKQQNTATQWQVKAAIRSAMAERQPDSAQEPHSSLGNSQLLMDYRAALINAYELGEEIKRDYNIVPPKVLHDKSWPQLDSNYPTNRFTIGLTVS